MKIIMEDKMSDQEDRKAELQIRKGVPNYNNVEHSEWGCPSSFLLRRIDKLQAAIKVMCKECDLMPNCYKDCPLKGLADE